MTEKSAPLVPTPGQTIGPFFGYALPFDHDDELVPPGHPDAIRLHGDVLDGQGHGVPDALLELWQAGPDGSIPQQPGPLRRDGWTFTGWGRASTDDAGHYSFTTTRPGRTASGTAPFFALAVFARGLTDRLFTRAYLPDHHDVLHTDALLSGLGPRADTLLTSADTTGYRFDIRLQGERETVFLTYPERAAR